MITVYVPTYNRASHLREALTSLRLQTLDRRSFRVVVADNASTDRTPEVVREFADLAVVYLRRDRNVGLVANWCGAREFFDSEHFQFLSDDDLLAPYHLEFCLRQLEARPGTAVFGTGVLFGEGLWEPDTRRGDLRLGDRFLDRNDLCYHWPRETWLAAHSIYSAVNINACLFRTEALRPIDPLFDPEISLVVDRWMMAQVGAEASCVTTPWPTCALRVHGENAVHGTGILDTEDLAREVARRVLDLARRHGFDLAGYWRGFLRESGTYRPDIVRLIRHAYPADLVSAALEGVDSHSRRLDGWPLPEGMKQRVRSWRARWRRARLRGS